jgi:ElaB/YqjD/DUF883 family membrane-anchored ribosome-binding protein
MTSSEVRPGLVMTKLGTLIAHYTAIISSRNRTFEIVSNTSKEITSMSQNRTSTDFPGTPQTESSLGSSTMGSSTGNGGTGTTGTGTGTATALAQTAQQYGEKISEVASQAKDYVADKVGVVGDKLKELQNADLGEIAESAKDYARKNPGQAILISAAAGLLVGLIIRGRR